MTHKQVVLCSPVRTAIGTYGGSLKDTAGNRTRRDGRFARAVERSGLDPSQVQAVVMGQVVQAGARMNPSRQAAIGATIPVDVPAMTVNRVCGSGAQAIASAAQEVMLGHVDCAVAGGMENMDQAPYLDAAGPLGLPHGRCSAVRQHASRRSERRLLRGAFGLAHGRSGEAGPDHARGSGPLGRAFPAPVLRGAGRGQVQA